MVMVFLRELRASASRGMRFDNKKPGAENPAGRSSSR
jgi:hypothetical protein